MKLLPKTRVVPTAVVLGLVAVLAVLAVLQYRWSREVSEAASERMKASVHASLMGLRHDFLRELAAVCSAFHGDPGDKPRDWANYVEQFQAWSRTATHPDLVANVFVVESTGADGPQLLRLNTMAGQVEPVEWPAKLQELSQILPAAPAGMGRHGVPPEVRRPRGRDGAEFPGPSFPNHGPFGGPWMVDQNVPALVHPLLPPGAPGRSQTAPPLRWLIVELNAKLLREHLFPELAERYFSGPAGLEYNVAVLGTKEGEAIYSSDAAFGKSASGPFDARVAFFGIPFGPPPGPAGSFPPGVNVQVRRDAERVPGRHDAGFGLPRFEPIRHSVAARDWQLVVQHRKGSLDVVVAGIRRRNLGVSFGVLLVLAATMAMILVASQRAHRLAQLQMDFVTGVSHELRTPLAVISSAADNIADGVVDSKQQLARYGSVIKKQAAQLNHLIEHILLFAAARQHRLNYTLRPVQVAELVDTALNHTADLTMEAGIRVDRTIEPNLPPVMGDLPALSQCLQNLITNAVKYGGEDRWIGVRATTVEERGGGEHVRISVADHGAGIDAAEQQHIFEPFYRSPAVTAAQIHGTGLGLPLARSIAEAMGGRLSVSSEPGKGTTFSLHLPACSELPSGADAAARAVSGSSAS